MTGADRRVVFVCWGNICRSPMAERVAERMAEEQGLSGVHFTSAATSTEELGEPIDPRAMAVLQEHGYRTNHHRRRESEATVRLILRLLANMGALAVATWLLSGITLTAPTTGRKVLTLLIVALIFGVVNAIVKPIFTLVTAIAVVLTLGLFLIVINALMLLLTSWISDQFNLGWSVDGFWTAVLGSIIVSVVSFIVNAFIPEKDEDRRDRR